VRFALGFSAHPLSTEQPCADLGGEDSARPRWSSFGLSNNQISHFLQRDFWPGIIFALPVGSRPVKPFCSMACHLQLNTKFLLQLRYS
jgi:hypothetical protein